MLDGLRNRLAEALQSPDGSRRREHIAIAILLVVIVGFSSWGVYRTFFKENPELTAGDFRHYICTKCGHHHLLDKNTLPRDKRLALELGPPSPIDCPKCGGALTAKVAHECPKCGKPFLVTKPGQYTCDDCASGGGAQ